MYTTQYFDLRLFCGPADKTIPAALAFLRAVVEDWPAVYALDAREAADSEDPRVSIDLSAWPCDRWFPDTVHEAWRDHGVEVID